jgi:hypothetical protein
MTEIDSAQTELRDEFRRILQALRSHLLAPRQIGRTQAANPLRGMAIEESEAEGLIDDLAEDLARALRPRHDPEVAEVTDPDRIDGESPLRRAARVFQLGAVERDALVLAIAVELDRRFARIVAYLNDHIARTRPTVGLILALSNDAFSAIELCERPAIRRRLLLLEGDGPVSALALRVAPEILPRLVVPLAAERPSRGVRLRQEDGPSLDDLVVGSAQREQLRRWAALCRTSKPLPPLVLAGAAGAGRATAAQSAASSIGRRLVEVDWTAERADCIAVAGREALWHGAVLLVRLAPDAPQRELKELWAGLAEWEEPLALAVPPSLADLVCAAAPVEPALVYFASLTVGQREELWRRLLPAGGNGQSAGLSEADRIELAARYDLPPGMLARAVRRAAADRDGAPDFIALSNACRAVGAAGMGPLAQRLPQPYTREDLVLPQDLLDELDLAAVWIRNRRRVFEDWGFGRRVVLGRGLTALFAGEPGTGKTMAAQVLARELGLDLFRVDLSRVMSKYIGETEKNLSQLFDDAGASGAILFFDEADALFGKRTEVKDAHDRYANLEIGYLLQRMEEHTGTTVLATNRMGDLDEAFTRRFHFILDFPMPRQAERRRIWEGMLPREAECQPEIDLDCLARDYEISGGEIRNSVLCAAFLAASQGTPIGLPHLKRGLRRELLKTGRVLDGKQRRALDGD